MLQLSLVLQLLIVPYSHLTSVGHLIQFFLTVRLAFSTESIPKRTALSNLALVCIFLFLPLSLIRLLAPGADRNLRYFSQVGFDKTKVRLKRNASVAELYEDAIRNEGAIISSSGALINFSGKKTGRSPKDKRIVFEDTSRDDIWWGHVNIQMDER